MNYVKQQRQILALTFEFLALYVANENYTLDTFFYSKVLPIHFCFPVSVSHLRVFIWRDITCLRAASSNKRS
jgi:hypothetical protein